MSRKIPTLGAQFAPTYHRPFLRYFDGEAGAAGGTPPATPPVPAPPAAAPAPTPPPAPAPVPPAPEPPKPVDYRGNPDEYVRELRAENKTAREAREAAEQKLAQEQADREAAATERDQLKRENTLLLAAPKYGARPDLLLDSSSFMKTFANVDLSDESLVKKAIEEALEKNSAFKAGPTLPPASGGAPQGGGDPNNRPKTIAEAVTRRYAQT